MRKHCQGHGPVVQWRHLRLAFRTVSYSAPRGVTDSSSLGLGSLGPGLGGGGEKPRPAAFRAGARDPAGPRRPRPPQAPAPAGREPQRILGNRAVPTPPFCQPRGPHPTPGCGWDAGGRARPERLPKRTGPQPRPRPRPADTRARRDPGRPPCPRPARRLRASMATAAPPGQAAGKRG